MVQPPRPTLNTFKQIFLDWFGEFLRQYPEYEGTRKVVEKMLGCGDKENGYSEFMCPHCSEKKVVAFS
jgi:hypothetical protein